MMGSEKASVFPELEFTFPGNEARPGVTICAPTLEIAREKYDKLIKPTGAASAAATGNET